MMAKLFLFVLIFLSWRKAAPEDCVAGTVVTATDLQYGVLIAKSAGSSSSAAVVVPAKGTFQFRFCELKSEGKPIDLLYRGIAADTLYVGTIADPSQKVRLTYPLKIRKNALGHWVCPKCCRADKTLKMVYGDGVAIPASQATRKRAQGCINNGTRGYCSRDRINF